MEVIKFDQPVLVAQSSSFSPSVINFDQPSVLAPDFTIEVEMISSITITPTPQRATASQSASHLLNGAPQWEQVRDYVVTSIQKRWGAFPRNPVREAATFKSFCERWGDKAMPIAVAAVEVHHCQWKTAPLSVQRFCRNSDPYFSEVIAANL